MIEPVVGRGFGHAKVILLGEHAVVHGHPALAAAVGLGARATAGPGGPLLEVPRWRIERRPDEDDDLARAFAALLGEARGPAREARVVVEAEVPSRAGLGSSAALAVAVARALAAFGGEGCCDDARIEAWAGRAEDVFHGPAGASGVDAAVAARGGVLRFVRGEAPRPLALAAPLPAVLARVEPRAPTHEMVARVARALEAEPGRVGSAFERTAALVDRAVGLVETGQGVPLGGLLDEAHALLAGLGLSTPALERACEVARAAGAAGAKLTGAGGGGCVVALAPGRQREVAEALATHASWVVEASLGGR